MEIIAFANSKGGTTKSTSVTNFAALGKEYGHKILVIDCDPQKSSTVLSGVDIDNIEHDLSDALTPTQMLLSDIAQTSKYGFDIVPAGAALLRVCDYLYDTDVMNPAMKLKKAINRDPELDKYDYIFLDLAGDMSRFTRTMMFAADSIVIPMVPEMLSQEALSNLIEHIIEVSNLRMEMNFEPLKIRKLFLNRAMPNRVSTRKNVQDIIETIDLFGGAIDVAETIIPHSATILNDTDLRVPYVIKHPNSDPALKTQHLYNEIFVSA